MKKISSIICFLIFLGNLPITLKSQTATEKLSRELRKTFQSSNIPGIAVAIVNQDKVLYQNQFGYADIATKKPYTQNTIHNIGSTTKTFIGVALMQLIEQGKLTLDTKINEVLPFKVTNPYHPEIDITVRHLATHTSSIKDNNFNYNLRAYVSTDDSNRKGLPFIYKILFKRILKNEDIPMDAFMENTLSKEGKWYKKKNYYKDAPGTTVNYSNISAALAGYVVEVITGQKYADYVQQNILKPLGMRASGWTKAEVDQTQFASRYLKGKTVPDYHLITYPDGGLISSTADLSTYLMAMIKGYKGESPLLSAASFQTMMTSQLHQAPLVQTVKNAERHYGVFWNIFGEKGKGDIGHSGSDPGILSFMYFDPKTGVGCVLTTNTDENPNIAEVIKMWELLVKYKAEF